MKLTIALLFISLSSFGKPNVDTIDNWQVYYNKRLIARYNEVQKGLPVVIERSKIRAGDSLIVAFSDDTPCHDCKTVIYLYDKKRNKIVLAQSKGTWTPLKTSLLSLAAKSAEYGNSMDIYYQDGRRNYRIFQLILK